MIHYGIFWHIIVYVHTRSTYVHQSLLLDVKIKSKTINSQSQLIVISMNHHNSDNLTWIRYCHLRHKASKWCIVKMWWGVVTDVMMCYTFIGCYLIVLKECERIACVLHEARRTLKKLKQRGELSWQEEEKLSCFVFSNQVVDYYQFIVTANFLVLQSAEFFPHFWDNSVFKRVGFTFNKFATLESNSHFHSRQTRESFYTPTLRSDWHVGALVASCRHLVSI